MSRLSLKVGEETFDVPKDLARDGEPKSWSKPLLEVMGRNVYAVGQYEFDMGDTTNAKMEVRGVYSWKGEPKVERKRGYFVLAQNVPPSLRCVTCKKKATVFQEDGPACDECSRGEDADILINSPRKVF